MERATTASGMSEFRQHGLVLLPAMAGIMFCSIHGYSLGVMIGPLEQEFGWARAQISTGPLIVSRSSSSSTAPTIAAALIGAQVR